MHRLKILAFLFVAVFISVPVDGGGVDNDFKNFRCLKKDHEDAEVSSVDVFRFQVSDRVTHQLSTRIYGIFLREMLNYKYVSIYEMDPDDTLYNLVKMFNEPSKADIDLEHWSYPNGPPIPPTLVEAGPITSAGRHGLFIPKILMRGNDTERKKFYSYTIFQSDIVQDQNYNTLYRQFTFDDEAENFVLKIADNKTVYKPDHCRHTACAAILTGHYSQFAYIVPHIEELKLKLQVYWVGSNLKKAVRGLLTKYKQTEKYYASDSKFLVLHWTPSEVTKGSIDFVPILMPRCEDMTSSVATGCLYELASISKISTDYFQKKEDSNFHLSLTLLLFNSYDIKSMINVYERYENDIDKLSKRELNNLYNRIACDWLKENMRTTTKWRVGSKPLEVKIGGIFPFDGTGTQYHQSIVLSAKKAISFINQNRSILPKYNLRLIETNGKCKPDEVMKNFISYYNQANSIFGVLGPACSHTVEPIAGVSKHFRMVVISYAAEGVSFANREQYPYFFRTIGENSQYEDVYVELLKKLGWSRVAALTEDGHKHTEYITNMNTLLLNNKIELMSRKFPSTSLAVDVRSHLLFYKSTNAKIIIADIQDQVAQIILCEAYKLKMTAKHGFVWFLPVWITKEKEAREKLLRQTNIHVNCTSDELADALEGHFSLSHAPFGNLSSIMQEGRTIEEWLKDYMNTTELTPSNIPMYDYGGYAYDAIWVYAKVLARLAQEDIDYIGDWHSERTTKRIVELMKEIDFNGVSGRIRFGKSGSRFTIINIMQFVNGKFTQIGNFVPNVTDNVISGGELKLNETAIVWLSPEKPDDGKEICFFSTLADFLGVECSIVSTVFTVFICVLIVTVLSACSFWFWKRRYDKKIERSAKIMKNFGIDLYKGQTIESTLDKWEIPKDRVVVNRRLGEGAFGTVYGGEAQIQNTEGWTAVAVKTLKVGSTTEDRLDFLSEAEAMKKFDHKNIVKLLAVCLQSEPVYTIMEFMLYGDLKTYLLARRHLVNEKVIEDSDISAKRLTMMSLDICHGLSYLAAMNYVHRDIAMRNCMVDCNRVVKIGDFGMARPMFEKDYYKFNRKGMLPVRWMAPESLVLGYFTPASDVWSFGVVLFEIITFGSFPFQGMTNNQVLEYVKNGNHLSIPNVKPQLEGLMKACFNQDYKKRPSASEISEFISNYPRLLTPVLDVPLSAVQIESESDQLELLPGLRKRSVTPSLSTFTQEKKSHSLFSSPKTKQENFELNKSATLNNLDLKSNNNHINGIYLNELNLAMEPTVGTSNGMGTSNGNGNGTAFYNPVEPLLQRERDPEISKSSSSLMRYVPMCGFSQKNRSSSLDRQCASVL